MTGIIVVDKPAGWTSHDVVGKLRKLCGERKIGHSGTLDPMATGVLPVFIGRATRAVGFAESDDKEYVAGVHFGIETDTQDITGNVLHTSECCFTMEAVAEAMGEFIGDTLQTPPMYSAIKVNGQKLYQLARKGQEIERTPRRVHIHSLELLSGEKDEFVFKATVSKGTYIRTLCHDIGMRLGCGGVLTSLRRTRAGEYSEDDSVTIDSLITAAENGQIGDYLRPVDSIFAKYPAVYLGSMEEKSCRNGGGFTTSVWDGLYRVYSEKNEFLMLGEAKEGRMTTIKSFFEV